MNRERLADLEALARLRADRSAGQLEKFASAIDRLERKVQTLRETVPDAPEDVAEGIMRDRWHRWRRQQISTLNLQLARLQAAAQPLREAHARDLARKTVLEKLVSERRR